MNARDDDQQPLCTDPLRREQERERLAKATEAFLAKGGQVEQVGFKMKNAPQSFVISARKTPVYAHLFDTPEPLAELPVTPAEPPRVVGTLEVPASLQPAAANARKTDPRKVLRKLRNDAADARRLMARLEQMIGR